MLENKYYENVAHVGEGHQAALVVRIFICQICEQLVLCLFSRGVRYIGHCALKGFNTLSDIARGNMHNSDRSF
jgi:hypothetical protein